MSHHLLSYIKTCTISSIHNPIDQCRIRISDHIAFPLCSYCNIIQLSSQITVIVTSPLKSHLYKSYIVWRQVFRNIAAVHALSGNAYTLLPQKYFAFLYIFNFTLNIPWTDPDMHCSAHAQIKNARRKFSHNETDGITLLGPTSYKFGLINDIIWGIVDMKWSWRMIRNTYRIPLHLQAV